MKTSVLHALLSTKSAQLVVKENAQHVLRTPMFLSLEMIVLFVPLLLAAKLVLLILLESVAHV